MHEVGAVNHDHRADAKFRLSNRLSARANAEVTGKQRIDLERQTPT